MGIKDGLLLMQIRGADRKDWTTGRGSVAEALDVGLTKLSLPCEHFASDCPRPVPVSLTLDNFRQGGNETRDVLHGCHTGQATYRKRLNSDSLSRENVRSRVRAANSRPGGNEAPGR